MEPDTALVDRLKFSLHYLERHLPGWNGGSDSELSAQMRSCLDTVFALSGEMKGRTGGVDWRKLNALRNAFLHDYLGLNAVEIQRTFLTEIPRLKNLIQAFVQRGGVRGPGLR